MCHSAYLLRKQKRVLEDLFAGSFSVQETLDKWKVARRTYHKWHSQEHFSAEFKRLLSLKQLESELVLAHYSSDVAAKLVSLTGAEKEETARKACLDIINHPAHQAKKSVETNKPPVEEELPHLTPELASRLLHVIADERRRVKALKTAQDGNLGNFPSDEISQNPEKLRKPDY